MYANNISAKPKGFIALMSAIVISAILIVATVTGSLTGFYTRFNVLDSEFKNRSTALAEACADVLLYKLGNDSGYNGPDMNYAVGSDTCNIFAATNPGATPRVFKLQGIYQHSYTNLQLTVDVDTLTVTAWQETAN
jgi:hypothetical protein